MQKKKEHLNTNGLILCVLILFVIAGTVVCVIANAGEAAAERARIETQNRKSAWEKAAVMAQKAAASHAQKQGANALSLQPGVPAGTQTPSMDEKIVYLTFDDGPSENTRYVLDILNRYNVRATFFITGANKEFRPLIKEAYEAGHTIGLHTYSHDYAQVYASIDAFFEDLNKIGQVAKEQIGYIPCFIRFPGGSSNSVSAKYCEGIMTRLTSLVQEKGYQYYDWNVDSGDGAAQTAEQIRANSVTERFHHVVLLFHDSQTKHDTVEVLPSIIQAYKDLGYEFRAIDRDSFSPHHSVNN